MAGMAVCCLLLNIGFHDVFNLVVTEVNQGIPVIRAFQGNRFMLKRWQEDDSIGRMNQQLLDVI